MPNEYLSKIKKGLDMLRTGTIYGSYGKRVGTNNKIMGGCLEIRDDQIRIIYRHLKDNNYIILGVMVKKTDKDTKNYAQV